MVSLAVACHLRRRAHESVRVHPGPLQAVSADWFVKELPRKDTPKWYRDNAFWLAASSGTNPLHLYLRDYFELPYAIWWCRWEKVSDEHSPLLMALPGNAENEMLRARGIYVHGYVNGRLWGFDEGKNIFPWHPSSPQPI